MIVQAVKKAGFDTSSASSLHFELMQLLDAKTQVQYMSFLDNIIQRGKL